MQEKTFYQKAESIKYLHWRQFSKLEKQFKKYDAGENVINRRNSIKMLGFIACNSKHFQNFTTLKIR